MQAIPLRSPTYSKLFSQWAPWIVSIPRLTCHSVQMDKNVICQLEEMHRCVYGANLLAAVVVFIIFFVVCFGL